MKEPSWTADPLSYLIDSVSNEVFFAQHYEQEALICAHNDPNHFAELLSIKRVDEIIAREALYIELLFSSCLLKKPDSL